jgi:hypothetical protein
MSSEERERIFFSGFSDEFLQDALRTYKTVYAGITDECKRRYDKPEAFSVLPVVRRAELEKELAALCASRYSHIKVEARPNRRKTSWYRLFSSNGVVLTVSALMNPAMVVRPAAFREEHATSSQYNLFIGEPLPDDYGHLLYAILAHGASIDKSRPAFIDIKFPDQECKRYVDEIKLLSRYPQLVTALWPASTQEKVEDSLEGFRLRDGAKEKANKEGLHDRKKDKTG